MIRHICSHSATHSVRIDESLVKVGLIRATTLLQDRSEWTLALTLYATTSVGSLRGSSQGKLSLKSQECLEISLQNLVAHRILVGSWRLDSTVQMKRRRCFSCNCEKTNRKHLRPVRP